VANGTYTVTPSLSGYSFSPTSASVTVSNGNASVAAFTATAQTYSISGVINGAAGATVTLTSGGSTTATLTSGASGTTYTFNNVPNGTYTVTPSLSGYSFSPTSASVTVSNGNASVATFTGTTGQSFSISGTIAGPTGVTVTLTASGSTVATTTTNASGAYSFTSVPNGSYTVTPSFKTYIMTPTSSPVTVSGANVGNLNFTASETLFTTQTPALTGKSDGSGVNFELGTLFQSGVAGQITAIRFWKDSHETGTHTGHIWSSTGTLLATVTFANETASGWQTQSLTTPLAITASTSYMVSVNTGNSYYVDTFSGLASKVTNLDLSSVVTTNNGAYGSVGTFPTSSYENSNYFRDVVFVP